MNSRERVVSAIHHKEPDKVPLDLNGTLVTALTRTAYDSLRKYLKMPPDPKPVLTNREMDTVLAGEDMLKHYEVDTRCVRMKAPMIPRGRELGDDSYYDGFGIRWRKALYYYDAIERPLKNPSIEELAHAQCPDPHDAGLYKGLRQDVKALFEKSPCCLVGDIPGLGPFEGGCMLRGHDHFCMDLALEPRYAEALLDKVTDHMIQIWGHFLDEVGEYVQVVAQGDDVGIQNGPFISPEMYRKFVKPRKKRIFDFVKTKTKAKIFYHSCGSVYDLIPDFIDEGVDILNPIQRSADKMDIRTLKREFGSQLSFWGGGIDIQQQLPFMSPDEIEDEVKRTIDILAPGGGFVFFPSHNIQADVAPEKIDRMFKTVLSYGGY